MRVAVFMLVLVSSIASTALAQDVADAPVVDAPATTVAEAPSPKNWFFHANLGFNLFGYMGPTDTSPASIVHPGVRGITVQQLGVGYWVHPNVRLQLTLWAAEALWGRAGDPSLAMASVIPWVVYTQGRFFAGAGPVIAPWSYGAAKLDFGLFTAAGYGFPIADGWGIAAAVQLPFWFGQRFLVQVTPAAVLTKRF